MQSDTQNQGLGKGFFFFTDECQLINIDGIMELEKSPCSVPNNSGKGHQEKLKSILEKEVAKRRMFAQCQSITPHINYKGENIPYNEEIQQSPT